jgi:type I restriction enzyme M protein
MEHNSESEALYKEITKGYEEEDYLLASRIAFIKYEALALGNEPLISSLKGAESISHVIAAAEAFFGGGHPDSPRDAAIGKFALEVAGWLKGHEKRGAEEGFISKIVGTDDKRVLGRLSLLTEQEKLKERDYNVSPSSAIELAKAFLDVKPTDAVADFCSGNGAFLSSFAPGECKSLTGYEINYDDCMSSKIALYVNGSDFEILHDDVLSAKMPKFDRIFCEFPMGMIYDRPLQTIGCQDWSPVSVTKPSRSNMSWVFMAKVLSQLSDGGIAVCITSRGSLFSAYEEDIRRQVISKGLLNAVIVLPHTIRYSSGVITSMLIFSQGNKEIEFVDATRMEQMGNLPSFSFTQLTDRAVEKIADIVKKRLDTQHSFSKTDQEIERLGCSLDFNTLISPEPAKISEDKNPEEMRKLVSLVVRSAFSSKGQIREEEDSGIRVLMSSDIPSGNGEFSYDSLPFFLNDEAAADLLRKGPEKYLLHDGDVVVTNKSTVVKTTVVKLKPDQKVVLFGSLYGLRVDPRKADPYFIKGFLSSWVGVMAIGAASTGTIISMITERNLLNIKVPCPPLGEQKETSDAVRMNDQIAADLATQKKKLNEESSNLFNDFLAGGR